MPRDALLRNRLPYDVAVEVRASDEESIYGDEKLYPFGGYPEDTEHISDPNPADSSFLSPLTLKEPKRPPVHSREPSLRASWLEVSCAVAGGIQNLLPVGVIHHAKSSPNLLVVERMTTV